MSKSVDDIWKALKANTAPRDSRSSGLVSSAVLASSLPLESTVKGQREDADNRNDLCGVMRDSPCDIGQKITQRDVNCLADPDRNLRKQAIKKLCTILENTPPESWSLDLITILESESLRSKVLHMLGDQTDVCRESAMDVIKILVSAAPHESALKLQALQSMKQRMGLGQACPLEPSEEIRLKIAYFTATVMVSKATDDDTVIEDIAAILSRCLDDSFHETKKCACLGLTTLARTSQLGKLAGVCGMVIKPLVEVLRHPHSRVRAAGMQAVTSLGENTPLSSELLATKVVPAFRVTAVDKSCDLRLGTFRACASWLNVHMAEVGRSWFIPHLLPVLLLGITDSSPEAAAETLAMLSQVAQSYCHQEDNSSCNTMEQLEHTCCSRADAAAATRLPPPLDKPAPVALRAMMNAQLGAILSPVLDDVKQWTAALRSTASRCLYSIMALSEEGVTRHLDRILPCLCQAVADDDEAVTMRIIHCIHLVGAYCEVAHWMPLILEYVATLKGQPNATVCALVAMSGLALAAGRASKPVCQEHLEQMAEWLASEEMRSLQHIQLQRQLAMVVANVIDLAGPGVAEVAKPLFHSLVHLQGHELDTYTTNQIRESQEKLATACGVASSSELAGQYACSLITAMLQQSDQWSSSHPDIPGFLTVVRISPGETLSAMGKQLCQCWSCIVRDHEQDPALRMALLRSVDGLLQSLEQGHAFCTLHGRLLLDTVILPPLIWRAGVQLPHDMILTQQMMFVGNLTLVMEVQAALKALQSTQAQILPLLFQSMDEDWYVDTRKLACCTLTALLTLAGCELTDGMRRQVYPELNKRMDDSNNDVRITAAAAVQAFASHAMPSTYCSTNAGYFIGAFIIHLDDADTAVQSAVLAALQEVKLKKPALLKAEISKVYDNFRSKQMLDTLLAGM